MTEQNRDSMAAEWPSSVAVGGPAPVRPPNRPAHERLLEGIGAKLGAKEERRKFLGEQLKVLRDQQGQAREEKEGIGEERKKVDDGLTALNKQGGNSQPEKNDLEHCVENYLENCLSYPH